MIVFPKTGEAEDLMMGAPSEIDEKLLEEAGIRKTVSKKITIKEEDVKKKK